VNGKPSTNPPVFPSFTPRIYSSCRFYFPSGPPTEGHLAFTRKLEFPNCSCLLFTARLSSPSSPDLIPVLVKPVHGWYGEGIHHLSAKHSLAPVLHTYSCPDGAPKACYVQPPSCSIIQQLRTFPQLLQYPTLITQSSRYSGNERKGLW